MRSLRTLPRAAGRIRWLLIGVLCLTPAVSQAVAPFVLETVDPGGGSIVGEYTSLKIDRLGRPHIAYYDANAGNLKYARYNGTQWLIETADSSIADVGQFASLALDSLDRPHIAYYDETIGKLRYTTKSGATWRREIADSNSFDCGWYPSIAIDPAGRPSIASYDRGRGNPRYSTRLSAGNWIGATIDTTFDLSGFYASLAIDSKSRPHVSYLNLTRGILQYATRIDGIWRQETADSSSADVGYYSSLKLDRFGRVHIAYMDLRNGLLKHALRNPATQRWSREVVDGGAEIAGYDCALTMDAIEFPNISYHNGTTLNFMMARQTPTGWQKLVVDDSPGVTGLFSSIASDSMGNMFMSYHDGSAYTLRFARLASQVLDAGPLKPRAGLALSPNPARSGERVRFAGAPDTRTIELFDLAGRRVARLTTDATGHTQWDGRTTDGAPVAAGLYFARALRRDGSTSATKPIVLTR